MLGETLGDVDGDTLGEVDGDTLGEVVGDSVVHAGFSTKLSTIVVWPQVLPNDL